MEKIRQSKDGSEALDTRNLYKVKDIWYIDIPIGNKRRIRKSTHCADLKEAIEWRESHYPSAERIKRDAPPRIENPLRGTPFTFSDEWITRMLYRMRSRFRDEVTISRDELLELFDRANGRCQVTGLPFSSDDTYGVSRKPFIPSIDRIDPLKPYQAGNCRIVCLAANLSMNQWGERVFDMMVLGRLQVKLMAI